MLLPATANTRSWSLPPQHLEHNRWYIASIGQEVATPTQRTELDTEAQLVACAATLGNLAEVGIDQGEVLAQDIRVDLSWWSLTRVFNSRGLLLRLDPSEL